MFSNTNYYWNKYIIYFGFSKWKCELDKAIKENRKPSLLRALLQMFGSTYIIYGFVFFINEMILKWELKNF